MIEELIKVMKCQEESLFELLMLLKVQYEMIMKKDKFGLEGMVDKLKECSKKIAMEEMNRRKLIGDKSIKEIVSNSNNVELKKTYKKIQDTLNEVILKRDTNDMLLKQGLLFNSKMLNLMNPNREKKTYNSYGNLK